MECIWRWYNVEVPMNIIIKSRTQQIEESEPFKVTGAKIEDTCDFSDDIMGKSAEELFTEDLKKTKEKLQMEAEEPEGIFHDFKTKKSSATTSITQCF